MSTPLAYSNVWPGASNGVAPTIPETKRIRASILTLVGDGYPWLVASMRTPFVTVTAAPTQQRTISSSLSALQHDANGNNPNTPQQNKHATTNHATYSIASSSLALTACRPATNSDGGRDDDDDAQQAAAARGGGDPPAGAAEHRGPLQPRGARHEQARGGRAAGLDLPRQVRHHQLVRRALRRGPAQPGHLVPGPRLPGGHVPDVQEDQRQGAHRGLLQLRPEDPQGRPGHRRPVPPLLPQPGAGHLRRAPQRGGPAHHGLRLRGGGGGGRQGHQARVQAHQVHGGRLRGRGGGRRAPAARHQRPVRELAGRPGQAQDDGAQRAQGAARGDEDVPGERGGRPPAAQPPDHLQHADHLQPAAQPQRGRARALHVHEDQRHAFQSEEVGFTEKKDEKKDAAADKAAPKDKTSEKAP
ncbi:hypothetical protein ON010_g8566 [Phytophthora cinnamomi]|nr:hypothetical protein ON010_g8566 [Phytophthora cinnamomi]